MENNGIDMKSTKSKYLSQYLDKLYDDKDILKMLNRQFEYDKSILTLKFQIFFITIN